MKSPLLLALTLLSALRLHAQVTSFTYQGRLNSNGVALTAIQDFQFRLFAVETNGSPIAAAINQADLLISNGLFTALLDFGEDFDGSERWLEIATRPGTSSGAFTTLAPRQRITAAPYAIRSLTAGGVAGDSVHTYSILDGTIQTSDLSPGVMDTFWRVIQGDAGAVSLVADGNSPMEFYLGGVRAYRIEPQLSTQTSGPNIIGGGWLNTVSPGVHTATIAGGGINNTFLKNEVTGEGGTVGGGMGNTAGAYSTVPGGNGNKATGESATVGGGSINVASGLRATVAGGLDNKAYTQDSFIGGGYRNVATGLWASVMSGGFNTASGDYSVVAGGARNAASGQRSFVAGGDSNTAEGTGSFAAGYRAKARHTGAFVLADSQAADFASTGLNQFLIRAAGGMGLNTTNPQAALHIYSANNPAAVRVQSSGTPGSARVEFFSDPQGSANEWRPGYIQSTDNGGFTGGLSFVVNGTGFDNRLGQVETMRVVNGRVGIGTATPATSLHVVGTVTATAFNPPSDRNLKENFAPVSPREVLEKVAALPITRWNFKGDEGTPHLGPMAQDFHAAFSLGTDERHIATVDADGVALAAIQGLNEKLKDKDAKISALEKRLLELEGMVNRLSAALK